MGKVSKVDEGTKRKIDGYAKRAEELPMSTQLAIITVLPNIVNGASWGFSTLDEMSNYADDLKKDSNICIRKLSKNDVVVEVDPKYLIYATSALSKDIIKKKDLDRMVEDSTKALVDFEKFLINKAKFNFAGLVGVYCTNDTTTITYKGTSYPAFRIKLIQALELCNKYRYLVKVNNKWITPSEAIKSGQTLFDSLVLSPTKTGVFMQIRSTATPEVIKELETAFKSGK